MTRSRLWPAVVALFIIINVAGAGFAIAMGESMHALAHAVLLLVGYVGWLVAPWRRREDPAPAPQEISDNRIEYLQQSVDAVALEVERLGESQRFNEKLRAVRDEIPPPKKDQ
jgi:ABC-type transport system involved in cytochrome bd biosynthesis fused ATPase/permease subunit